MARYQVCYNPETRTATVQADNDAKPSGSTKIGEFNHGDVDDPISEVPNHVLFHHVRDALYHTKNSVPPVPGFWPDNITDMASITIVNDTSAVIVPDNTVAPAITGTPTEGEILTVSDGTWNASPSSYARQWFRMDAADASTEEMEAIAGANAATYTLAAGDVGKYIRAGVLAINAAGAANEYAFSNTVGPVAEA